MERVLLRQTCRGLPAGQVVDTSVRDGCCGYHRATWRLICCRFGVLASPMDRWIAAVCGCLCFLPLFWMTTAIRNGLSIYICLSLSLSAALLLPYLKNILEMTSNSLHYHAHFTLSRPLVQYSSIVTSSAQRVHL